MIALTGPSGAGKTTLLHLIAGLITPDAGTVSVDGQVISRMAPGARARWRGRTVGFAYQDARLLPQLDVRTNTAWPLLFTGKRKSEALERADALLKRLGLSELADHRPTTLSGGEQRRVALARALVAHPPLLLIDEPTANLDDDSAAEVLALIAQVRREFEVSTILVSHHPQALDAAERRVRLAHGRLEEVQPV